EIEEQLSEEYETLQEKIDAISRELESVETPSTEAAGADDKPAERQATTNAEPASVATQPEAHTPDTRPSTPAESSPADMTSEPGEDDFLKQRFFSVLEENAPASEEAPSEQASTATAEEAPEGGKSAQTQQPAQAEQTAAEVAPDSDARQTETPSEFEAAPVEEVPKQSGTAAREGEAVDDGAATAGDSQAPGEQIPPDDFVGDDGVEDTEVVAPAGPSLVERVCNAIDGILSTETRRGAWSAFGIASLALAVLVITMWLTRLIF
ncbi:MAG: hypothetical protein DRP79_09570, partial [Planctomycetota bacterium]